VQLEVEIRFLLQSLQPELCESLQIGQRVLAGQQGRDMCFEPVES